jgi:hypothetical protein
MRSTNRNTRARSSGTHLTSGWPGDLNAKCWPRHVWSRCAGGRRSSRGFVSSESAGAHHRHPLPVAVVADSVGRRARGPIRCWPRRRRRRRRPGEHGGGGLKPQRAPRPQARIGRIQRRPSKFGVAPETGPAPRVPLAPDIGRTAVCSLRNRTGGLDWPGWSAYARRVGGSQRHWQRRRLRSGGQLDDAPI